MKRIGVMCRWFGVIIALLLGCTAAQAINFQAAGTAVSSRNAITPLWPTHQTGDVALLIVRTANQVSTLSTPSGFVEVTGSPQATGTAGAVGATRLTVFWARATSNAMPSPVVADSGSSQQVQILTFRGVVGTGNPWDVTSGDVLATASTAFAIPGATTALDNDLVVSIVTNGTDIATLQTSAPTNASLTGLVKITDFNGTSGNGGGFGVFAGVKTTAGPYGSTTGTLLTSSLQGRMSIALKSSTTTLADGVNPGNVTLAPSGAITDLDAFTLTTSDGTNNVTGLTVTLTGGNAFQALSQVSITDSTGAITYFTPVANPASNTVVFSGGTPIPVTTTPTTFKVRITPKTHANMPVPPGLSYAVGGTVTAFTTTNAKAGTDGASATVTVDNLSPTGATATSGSAGAGLTNLNWTSSVSGDLAATSGSVVYRWAAASAGVEVPVEGSTAVVGGINGTATAACVVTSASSTALTRIDGSGGSVDCTNVTLTSGQAYTYKVFQKDASGNYDVGVLIGTFTAFATTTLATGAADPAAATIAPGAGVTTVDQFTLVTSNGTEAISSVTVNLSTSNGVGRLSIYNNAGTELGFTITPTTGSNTITVAGMSATTTTATFTVRITPLSHAVMPAPPGASYAITAPVTAWAGTNTHTGTDTNANALTIDNLSPNAATAISGSAGNALVNLNWTTSNSADFATTAGSVVYRWAAASAGTEVPAEGNTPVVGSTNGTATVACVANSLALTAQVKIDGTGGGGGCSNVALTNGQTYTYKVFQKDANGNYDLGLAMGSFTPFANTTIGTGTDPAAATIAPGTAVTTVNQFTLITSNGTETISSVTVNLSTSNGVGRLSIYNNAGTELGFTTTPTTGSNSITVTGMSATNASATFTVRITPLIHTAMPAPPGATYAITAPVTAWAGSYTQHLGSDTNVNALTIDNLSPNSATATNGSKGVALVNLNWTTSNSADFATTSGSVVYRWASTSAGAEVPTEGSTPALGSVNNTATVACLVSSAASAAQVKIDGTGGGGGCSNVALTNGQTYTYKVFQKDSNGNYDTGVTIGSFRPSLTNTTTLATGIDPAAATVAPGAGVTTVNQFTFITNAGSEAISSVTVNLSTSNGVGRLSIYNSGGTELGFTNSPVTGANIIAVAITAGTASSTYTVRITPLVHTTMPAPPGAAYAITAPVIDWFGPNAHAGSDSNANALTIDNLSPNPASAPGGTSGNAKVNLLWTASSSADFATTSGSVVYRWTASSAGPEVPTEGVIPTVGSTNLTATVACVVNSAVSAALTRTDGTGGSADCTTAALTNGTFYIYKVFQKDSNGNYDTGTLIGPVRPSLPTITTLATGSDPAAGIIIAPGGSATDVNGFTLITDISTENITSITVNLSTNNGIARLAITDSANAELGFTSSPTLGANTITVAGVTAGTTSTAFKVRVTPLSHALMPAPNGAAYAITAPVTVWVGQNTHAGTDTNTNALTIDNLSPASASATSGLAGSTQVTLSWTTSASTDFSRSVVLRWSGNSAGSEVPAEGSDYALNAPVGTATVACMRTSDAASTAVSGVDGTGVGGCSASALTNGQAYTYKIFQKDANGNYDTGVLIGSGTGTFTPMATVTRFNVVEPSADAVNGKIYTKIAGKDFAVDIVALDGLNAVATSFTGAVTVEVVDSSLASGICANMVVIATFTSQIFAVGDAGRHALTASNSVANVWRNAKVRIKYPAASPTITSCSTDNFAIRPDSLTVVASDGGQAVAGTANVLSNSGVSGGVIHQAGQPFTLTVTANNGATVQAVTTQYSGVPDSQSVACTLPTPTCFTGTVTTGSGSDWSTTSGSGVMTNNTVTYPEVGSFNLTLKDTTFAAVDAGDGTTADCVGQYVCSAATSVGRFIPDHFEVSGVTLTAACTPSAPGTAFTYFGQDGFTTAFTLTAKNFANVTTRNYTGNLAKLDVANYTKYGFSAATLPSGSALSSSATPPSAVLPGGAWLEGVATVTVKHQISRPTAVAGATPITISAAPSDGEVPAATTPTAVGSATTLRYGRLRLLNALGSELLDLPVSLFAQYWNGSGWVKNTDDACTTIPTRTRTAGLLYGTATGTTADSVNTSNSGLLVAGDAGLKFSKPSVAGYVDFYVSTPGWLQFPWQGGAVNTNPSGRATFGVYKSRLIYMRENY